MGWKVHSSIKNLSQYRLWTLWFYWIFQCWPLGSALGSVEKLKHSRQYFSLEIRKTSLSEIFEIQILFQAIVLFFFSSYFSFNPAWGEEAAYDFMLIEEKKIDLRYMSRVPLLPLKALLFIIFWKYIFLFSWNTFL